MSINLTDHQWDAVKRAAGWYQEASQQYEPNWDHFYGTDQFSSASVQQDYVFGGFAGSGKSTCVGTMIEHLGLSEDQVMYMAPTGKAAKVLTKKLRADGWNQPATTIHKAIYMPRSAKADQIKKDLENAENEQVWRETHKDAGPNAFQNLSDHDLDVRVLELENALREAMSGEGPSFTLKAPQDIPEGVKLFVVDEASMVGTEIAEDLKRFGIPILAIGDPGQLPPVGDTWGFNMEDPDVFLTEIHRQALDNPIIQLATMVREGKMLKEGVYGEGVKVVSRRNDDVTLNMDRDAMVLVGTHRKRWQLTSKIRKALDYSESGPMSGEPILVCRNSKNHPNLVNGTILQNLTDHGDLVGGTTRLKLTLEDPEAEGLRYDLWAAQCFFEEHVFKKKDSFSGKPKDVYAAKVQCEQLDFGHVLTVHKSQGSEWDDVVVHDESGVFRSDGSRWLYTGITRASKMLTVVT